MNGSDKAQAAAGAVLFELMGRRRVGDALHEIEDHDYGTWEELRERLATVIREHFPSELEALHPVPIQAAASAVFRSDMQWTAEEIARLQAVDRPMVAINCIEPARAPRNISRQEPEREFPIQRTPEEAFDHLFAWVQAGEVNAIYHEVPSQWARDGYIADSMTTSPSGPFRSICGRKLIAYRRQQRNSAAWDLVDLRGDTTSAMLIAAAEQCE